MKKKLIILPQAKATEIHTKELLAGFEMLKTALNKLMPSEKVEFIKNNERKVEGRDHHQGHRGGHPRKRLPQLRRSSIGVIISGYRGAVTLDPCIVDKETINSIIEVAGFSISTWKTYPATREQPEDYVDTEVGQYNNIGAAVSAFIKTIFSLSVDDYFQSLADEAMEAEWEKGEM